MIADNCKLANVNVCNEKNYNKSKCQLLTDEISKSLCHGRKVIEGKRMAHKNITQLCNMYFVINHKKILGNYQTRK